MPAQQIDEKKLERAIRKIKHCLALSKSANENEAATALRQAQALMREYRITEMDVKLSDVGEVESQFSRAERLPAWERNLSAAVAQVFGCTSLRNRQWCTVKDRVIERAAFVGVTPAQHIALYAFEALLTKLRLARKEYVTGVRSGKHRSSYSAETAGDHFALAWVGEVYGKLCALVPKGEEDATDLRSDGRVIVAVEAQDNALIDEYLTNNGVGKARKARETELDMNAQIAGMLAGRNVDLHAGISRGGDDLLALSDLVAKVITFRYVAEKYMVDIVPAKGTATQADNKRELKNLIAFFDDPPAPLETIEPLHVRQYLTWRKSAPVRANREKALLSAIWNYARDKGYTSLANPCAGIKGNKETGRDTYVEDALFKRMHDKADAGLQDAMDLAYLTGQRVTDTRLMDERDVRDGQIWVLQGKTKAKRRIEITGELKVLIDRIMSGNQNTRSARRG